MTGGGSGDVDTVIERHGKAAAVAIRYEKYRARNAATPDPTRIKDLCLTQF
jgi:hypothetical protein